MKFKLKASESINIEIEIVKTGKKLVVYIGQEDASGAKYPINSLSEVGNIVQEYIDSYVDFE